MKLIGKLFKVIGGIVVALVLIAAIFGGGSDDKGSSSASSDTASEPQASQEEPAADESDDETEATEDKDSSSKETKSKKQEKQSEPEQTDDGPSIAKDAKYAVTIDGWRLTEDYDGAPCIAVDYTFTNVSDDSATSMQLATNITVYQNGVECEDAWFADESSTDGYTNKVKAGVSVQATRAYKLQDTSSDVEIEVSQLFSWSDDLLAYEVIHIA